MKKTFFSSNSISSKIFCAIPTSLHTLFLCHLVRTEFPLQQHLLCDKEDICPSSFSKPRTTKPPNPSPKAKLYNKHTSSINDASMLHIASSIIPACFTHVLRLNKTPLLTRPKSPLCQKINSLSLSQNKHQATNLFILTITSVQRSTRTL